jgi:hypothetical protein
MLSGIASPVLAAALPGASPAGRTILALVRQKEGPLP